MFADEKLQFLDDIILQNCYLATILKAFWQLVTRAEDVDVECVQCVAFRDIRSFIFGADRLTKFRHRHTEASTWLYGIGSMQSVFEETRE